MPWQLATNNWQLSFGNQIGNLFHFPPLLVRVRDSFDQRDHRHEQRDDDEPDDDAQDHDHDRLEDADERADQHVHVAVIVVGDLQQHLVEVAGFFADVDHVDDDGVADLGGAERVGHRFALANGVVHLQQGAGIHLVAAGFAGDIDGVQDRHAGADERAQRSGEAGDGGLAQNRSQDRNLQLDHIRRVFARLRPCE